METPNVSYLFEEPGLFDEPRPAAPTPAECWITCRVCERKQKVGIDNPALLCEGCRVDLAATRTHVEETLALVETRWQAAVEDFDARGAGSAEWEKVCAANVKVAAGEMDAKLFTIAWARAKARGGALSEILLAKESLDALSDEVQARREWAARAIAEIEAAQSAGSSPTVGSAQGEGTRVPAATA